MTTLIHQKSLNDCALAAIAMAAGCSRWEDLWNASDLEAVIKSHGVGHGDDLHGYLQRAGFARKDYRQVYLHGTKPNEVTSLLWGRPALLSVNSLNRDGGGHMVYWDGDKLWDPSYERTYLHLSSCILIAAVVLRPRS